ncbi:MAG: tetratricopeptide repeat protein [Bacteroidia bacterium]|nr:tetratricopeptide repeat protein [Bacteroidia bacterium]
MLQKLGFIFFIIHLVNLGFSKPIELKKEDTLRVNQLNAMGRDSIIKGSYPKADSLIDLALELAESINFKSGLFNAYTNKGVVLWYQDNYPKALGNQFKALKVAEQMNNKLFMSRALANIGLIYASKSGYDTALDYYHKSLKIKEEIGDKKAVSILLGNMARIYNDKNDNQRALEFYFKSLKVLEEVKNNKGLIALNYAGIGNIYKQQGDFFKASDYFKNALRIADSLEDKLLSSSTLVKIGTLNILQKKYPEAENNLLRAFKISSEIGSITTQRDIYQALSELYGKINKWDLSLSQYKNYIKIQDSIFNQDNTKKMIRLEMNYEFNKKEESMKLQQEKKEALIQTERKKQQIIIWSIGAILIMVIIFAVYVYKSFKEKQRVNIEITLQKHIIEEKQKEILDSIHYAKRIQTALITSEKYIDKSLNRLNHKI